MRNVLRLGLCVFCALVAMPAVASVAIDNVRVYRAPEYTRFVFGISEPARYQVLPDAAPGRVVIDVRDAALKAKLETVDLKDSPVRRVRSGQQADGTTRIVLDLAVAVRVNSFALPPNELYGHRLVVDLYDLVPAAPDEEAGAAPAAMATAPATPAAAAAAVVAPAAVAAAVPAAAPPTPAAQAAGSVSTTASPAPVVAPAGASAPAVPGVATSAAPAVPAEPVVAMNAVAPPAVLAIPAPPATSAPANASAANARPPVVAKAAPPALLMAPRAVTIAIDAGHGGEDPGARGPRGTHEKDVVLAIARAVRDRVRAEPGMKPVLIRDGDYYVGLKERRTRARKKYDADLFVSIHADAFARREARGASVFAVSRRGATSTMAAYLANSENRADLVGGIDPKTDNDLISVISDMMMEGTMRESLQLGRGVLDELGGFARLHKRGVEQAGFMVLKEPNMPSILVETGFISNPEEERLLNDPDYQQRLARAVVSGVRRYFERSPPPGTWFAAHREKQAGGGLAKASLPAAAEDSADRPGSMMDPLLAAAERGAAALPSLVPAAMAEELPEDKPRATSGKKESRKVVEREIPAAKEKARAESFVRHKVGRGQSLGWLAQKYGVSPHEIKLANNLRRDDIRIGETLKIPQK